MSGCLSKVPGFHAALTGLLTSWSFLAPQFVHLRPRMSSERLWTLWENSKKAWAESCIRNYCREPRRRGTGSVNVQEKEEEKEEEWKKHPFKSCFSGNIFLLPQLEDWWLDTAYLEVRIPSQLNVNFAGPGPYLEHWWPPAEGVDLQRASISTWHTLQYWDLIHRWVFDLYREIICDFWEDCWVKVHPLQKWQKYCLSRSRSTFTYGKAPS